MTPDIKWTIEVVEDPEEDETPTRGFPRRQLSLSSANRKRLQSTLNCQDSLAPEEGGGQREIRLSLDHDPPNSLEQLASSVDSILVLEEDELHADSNTSCASSDDGFGSSCHDSETINVKTNCKAIKTGEQTEPEDFISDDSSNESDHQRKDVPDAHEVRRVLMANQKVTIL